MKKSPLKIALCVFTLAAAAGAQASCYLVMDAKGNILSQTQDPPIDMSYQLHQTVPYRYGKDATMTFSLADGDCGPPIDQYYNLTPQNAGYYKRYGGAPQAAAASTQSHKKKTRHMRRAHPSAAPATAPASGS